MDLSTLQQSIASVLNATEYFSDSGAGDQARPIPILTEDLGDLLNRITKATNRTGIFVFVQTPIMSVQYQDIPVPEGKATVICTVVENVTLNRNRATGGTGQAIGVVANAIAAVLHQNLDCGLPLFRAIQLSSAYLPQISRDVIFDLPVTTIEMPTRAFFGSATQTFGSLEPVFGS